jgi:signal transduction histidine kinase
MINSEAVYRWSNLRNSWVDSQRRAESDRADPERLDRSLETTAYFVGCEGLTNVIKHARATAVTMRAVRRNRSLLVSVADDGVGGARAREGSGLAGLADRVAAVGGRLHVESGTQGTLLTAEFPCG